MNWLYENLSLLHVRSSGYVEMNLKSEPTKLNGFNFQIISEGGGVDFTWFGVHTYMTGKTLSRQVYWLRKRLHVKLCKLWGLLYKSDGILVGNLKGRPIWVWLKLKLTTFKWDQNLQFTPLRETMSIPSLLYGIPPPPPPTTTTGVCTRSSRLKLRRLNSTSSSPGETYDVPIRAYNWHMRCTMW